MTDSESVEKTVLRILNSVSLIAAIVTCVILVGLAFFKYNLVDRVSLRIQGIIALIDIARHVSRIKSSHHNAMFCQFIGYSIKFSDHLYLLLNVAIALNIHRLLIQNKRPNKQLQWLYGSISFVLAAVINLIPLAAGKFGENRDLSCRFIDDESTKWWNILLVYSINVPGALYCLSIFILANSEIKRNKPRIQLIRGRDNAFSSDPMEFIWTLYHRISLYPLSCFITLFPFTLSRVFLDSNRKIPHVLSFIYLFCFRITGTLNFITMVSDPHCQIALKHLIRSIFFFKPLRELDLHNEISLSRADLVLSTPYYDELEYPNGDRIPVKEYIKLL